MNDLVPMVMALGLFYSVYLIFELVVRRKERMAIIDKLSEGIDPSVLDYKSKLKVNVGGLALRIGCLLVGIGLGIFIVSIVEYSTIHTEGWSMQRNSLQSMYPASAALFGGLGLIVSYLIERKNVEGDNK